MVASRAAEPPYLYRRSSWATALTTYYVLRSRDLSVAASAPPLALAVAVAVAVAVALALALVRRRFST